MNADSPQLVIKQHAHGQYALLFAFVIQLYCFFKMRNINLCQEFTNVHLMYSYLLRSIGLQDGS